MARRRLSLAWAALLLGLALPAMAAEPEDGTLGDAVTRPQGWVALSRFRPDPGPLRLHDDMGEADLFIPLAGTSRVKDMVLDLPYTNSAALKAGRSILAVRLNETTLAQIRLDPVQASGSAHVRLPAELWRAGYNKLTLSVTQHYTDTCEDPEAPELWTEIDLSRARLSYDLAPAAKPYLLSDLGSLFSPGLGGQGEVLLLTAPEAQADDLRRTALPYVAQALALRRQFAPLAVEHTQWRRTGGGGKAAYLPPTGAPGAVHVLLGTSDQLAQVLTGRELPAVDGPKVWLDGLDGGFARLVVTGRTGEEVVAAARSLTLMDDRLTPDSQVSFPGQRQTEPVAQDGRATMRPGHAYSFAALGTASTTMRGAGSHSVTVRLPVPADYYTHENAKVELALDFAYGAGMGPGSVINVVMNGEFIHGHLLDNKDGENFRGYRLSVPVRLLRPNTNILTFQISSRPQLAGAACVSVKGRHLAVQVLDSSTITIPEGGHAAVLPDLKRFAASGFPYVVGGDSTATIYAASPELTGGALTLIGKLAQASRGMSDGWRVETGLPAVIPGQAIVLATTEQLADVGTWSSSLARVKAWPQRLLQDLRSDTRREQLLLGDVKSALKGGATGSGIDLTGEMLNQRSGLGDLAVLMAAGNPGGDGDDSLMIIAADSVPVLTARIRALVGPALWSQMRDDLIAWRGTDEPMFTIQVADHYEVGRQSPWLLLRLTISTNPWYWLGGAAIALLVFAGAAYILLHRRKRYLEGG